MTQNVKWHKMSNDTKCQMSRNINVIKCQMSWSVYCHEMPIVMKCQMSWNAKCHEMPNIMKCWCWCWIYDSRQKHRRYTLRSVQSSPGRSFLPLEGEAIIVMDCAIASPYVRKVMYYYHYYFSCCWYRFAFGRIEVAQNSFLIMWFMASPSLASSPQIQGKIWINLLECTIPPP